MQNHEPLEQFLSDLQTINRHLRSKVFDQQANPMTRVQWLLLKHLHRMGSRTIGQLAVHLDVKPSTMSQMIDRMEKASLVVRKNTLADARVKAVVLTEEGESVIRRTEALWLETLDDSFGIFTRQERDALVDAMRRLSEQLNGSRRG